MFCVKGGGAGWVCMGAVERRWTERGESWWIPGGGGGGGYTLLGLYVVMLK